jgi:hypothetical protein
MIRKGQSAKDYPQPSVLCELGEGKLARIRNLRKLACCPHTDTQGKQVCVNLPAAACLAGRQGGSVDQKIKPQNKAHVSYILRIKIILSSYIMLNKNQHPLVAGERYY